MSKQFSFDDGTLAKKEVSPMWRGIGFIILIVLTVGAFWLSGIVIDIPAVQRPMRLSPGVLNNVVTIYGPLALKARYIIQLAATVVIDITLFAIMVVSYAIMFPEKPKPTDAPPVRRSGRRKSMTR